MRAVAGGDGRMEKVTPTIEDPADPTRDVLMGMS